MSTLLALAIPAHSLSLYMRPASTLFATALALGVYGGVELFGLVRKAMMEFFK